MASLPRRCPSLPPSPSLSSTVAIPLLLSLSSLVRYPNSIFPQFFPKFNPMNICRSPAVCLGNICRSLAVCLGNIYRSPAAEGVFTDLVKKRGLHSNFIIDSAGTIDYHEGNEADPRMRAASKRRGIQITSLSRPIRPSDFKEFDLILAMDKQNRDDILAAFERWSFRETLPPDSYKKVKLMCLYCKKHDETEVPDPYYGGPQGFEKVLDLLEDACESLLGSILAENNNSDS